MTETITAPDYRALPDHELAAIADQADEATHAAILAEFARRDRADRMAKARKRLDGIRAEGKSAAFAAYLEADAACRGTLLSREGIAAGIRDEQVLWTLPEEQAQRYASEELRDHWLYVAPRVTPAGYVRQCAAERRAELAAVRDSRDGGITDGHDGTGPGLAGNEPGPLRHGTTAPQTPQDGDGGTVERGRPAPDDTEDSTEADAGTGGTGGPVRPVAREDGDMEPEPQPDQAGDRPVPLPGVTILDEIEGFINRHAKLPTPHNARVMALMAGASYVTPLFPATFRGLFAGMPNSGKTTAMNITADMSSNPTDLAGTEPYARSAIIGAAGTPELGCPTFVMDDMKLFGDSGMNGSRDLRADVLRRGYKNGATTGVSRSQVDKKISVFAPFLMSGLEAVVQGDIRTRCIILWHEEGRPEQYYDLRYAVRLARDYGKSLKEAIGVAWEQLAGFRGDGYHPKMTGRYLEVWEPLLAVAKCIGGQKWVNYCIEAFTALTGNGTTVQQLTPRQKVVRDVVAVMDGPLAWAADQGFIPGDLLGPELALLPGGGYEGMNENALLQHIAANMTGIGKRQVAGLAKKGYPLDRMTGYLARDIRQEWDQIRPAEPSDVEAPEAVSPFEVTAEDDGDLDALLQGVQGVQGVSAVTADSEV